MKSSSTFNRYTDDDSTLKTTSSPSIGKEVVVLHCKQQNTHATRHSYRNESDTMREGHKQQRRSRDHSNSPTQPHQYGTMNNGGRKKHTHNDPAGEYRHQTSFRGKVRMGMREPSGLRGSEISNRQDHHNHTGEMRDDAPEQHRRRDAASLTVRTDASLASGNHHHHHHHHHRSSSEHEYSSWETTTTVGGGGGGSGSGGSISSKMTSISNSRSTVAPSSSSRHSSIPSHVKKSSSSSTSRRSSSVPKNIIGNNTLLPPPTVANKGPRTVTPTYGRSESAPIKMQTTITTPRISNLNPTKNNNKAGNNLKVKTCGLESVYENDHAVNDEVLNVQPKEGATRHDSGDSNGSNSSNKQKKTKPGKLSSLQARLMETKQQKLQKQTQEPPTTPLMASMTPKSTMAVDEGQNNIPDAQFHFHPSSPTTQQLPSMTPKSTVAVDESGRNNIDNHFHFHTHHEGRKSAPDCSADTNSSKKSCANASGSGSKKSLGGGFKRFLKKSNTNVSSITGWTKEPTTTCVATEGGVRKDYEVDYGIDPSRGSFDLVIVPKRTNSSRSNGSGGIHGGVGKEEEEGRIRRDNSSLSSSKENKKGHGNKSKSNHHHCHQHKLLSSSNNQRHITAQDAVSVASTMASMNNNNITNNIPLANLTYWSSLSVKAAMAVMQAKGSQVMAQKAANTVLEAGKQQQTQQKGKKKGAGADLRDLATKVSVVVLEAGGDHKVAAAVAVAIMNEENYSGNHRMGKSKGGVNGKKVKNTQRKVLETVDGSDYDNEESEHSSYDDDDDDSESAPLKKIASVAVVDSVAGSSSQQQNSNTGYNPSTDAYKSSKSSTTTLSTHNDTKPARILSQINIPIKNEWLTTSPGSNIPPTGGAKKNVILNGIPNGIFNGLREDNNAPSLIDITSTMDGGPSETPSMISKRHRLEAREAEIEERNRQLEEAERVNQQKEREIQERLRLLESAKEVEERVAAAAAAAAAAKRVEEARVTAEQESAAREKAAAEKLRREADEKAAAKRAVEEARRRAEEKAAKDRAAKEDAKRLELKKREDAKRLELQRKEEELARRNRELEERARQIAMQAQKKKQEEDILAQQRECEDIEWQKKREEEMARAKALEERARAIAMKGLHQTANEQEDIASLTTSMRDTRRHLEQREAEIAQRNRALEEATRLNLQKEAEIQKRMVALEAATKTVENKVNLVKARQIRAKEEADRRALKEKEEAIAAKNRELEEAARVNYEKEHEIRERMAALDAATEALLERAENVQQEIDQRRSMDAQQQQVQQMANITAGMLGHIDEDQSANSTMGPLPNHHVHFEHQHQYQHHPHIMRNNSGMRNNGEFSVATPHTFERQQAFDNQSKNNSRAFSPTNKDPKQLQRQQGAQNKGVFGQLTSKLYSILDVACDSSAWVAPKSLTPVTGDRSESRTALSAIDDRSYYSQNEGDASYSTYGDAMQQLQPRHGEGQEPPQPPRFKTPTMSGLTDDQLNKSNTNEKTSWENWFTSKNNGNMGGLDANQALNQALTQAMNQNRQSQHELQQRYEQNNHRPESAAASPRSMNETVSGPNHLLNQALNQAIARENKAGGQQPYNAMPKQPPLSPNQALNEALNQAMTQVRTDQAGYSQAGTSRGDTTQTSYRPGGVLKQPSIHVGAVSKAPINGPKSSLMRMKSSLFSSFKKQSSGGIGNKKLTVHTPTANIGNNNMKQQKLSQRNNAMRIRSENAGRQKMTVSDRSNSISNNMATSPKTVKTAESAGAKKGQLFSFSRKKSVLLEV